MEESYKVPPCQEGFLRGVVAERESHTRSRNFLHRTRSRHKDRTRTAAEYNGLRPRTVETDA
jgi:hypothetical protein